MALRNGFFLKAKTLKASRREAFAVLDLPELALIYALLRLMPLDSA
jgi:hypothetical protein